MASERGYGSATMSVGTVSNANGTIVAANASRRYLSICNTGGTACYLGFGGAAAINAGRRINGAGSVDCCYEMTQGLGNLYTGNVQAILTATGTALFSIIEGT